MEQCIVLLSTYNGEKYLREQLDSIISQEADVNIVIYVRDDGSKDSTRTILQAYAKEYPNRVLINEGENVGAQASFMELIRKAPEAEYYAFADQDDVWKPGKIAAGIQMLKQTERAGLYTANYSLCDQDLNIITEREISQKPLFSPIRCMMYNEIPGCTMIFNRQLLLEMRSVKIEKVRMHDIFCLEVAVLTGNVYFDSNSFIMHRIHENNVIGIGHKKASPFKWMKEKTQLIIKKENFDMSELADALLKAFPDRISEKQRADLILVSTFKKRFRNTCMLLRHPETKKKFGREMLSIRAKILFHLF